MPVTVLVGMQWGDEGKGKIVDLLSENQDIIARYQGGANAGHTVVIDGKKYILHLLPSGILREGKICVIGSGVVIDPEALFDEIDQIAESGIRAEGRLIISPRAHCILPVHKRLDMVNETAKSQKKIGTTGKGIGPTYSDKTQRIGIPLHTLIDETKLKASLDSLLEVQNSLLTGFYGVEAINKQEIFEELKAMGKKIAPYLGDTRKILSDAISQNKNILCEGAQGTMLDLDHGTYPFVTSSHTISGGACTGLGISPRNIDKVIGVIKAYTTRVGEGPFPTELNDENGTMLQEEGHEFGATTGRRRRCGWFDAVVARYSREINGVDEICITKLDVLDKFKKIQVCVSYKLDGKTIDRMPDDTSALERAKPVYMEFDGWQSQTADANDIAALPDNAKRYVDYLENETGAEAKIISTGQDRNATIFKS